MKPMSNMRSASSITSTSHVAQRVDALLEVVDQPARRTDEDVAAVAQLVALLGVVDAAVHRMQLETGELAEQLRVVQDLHDQLARRRDDQARGPAASRLERA